MPAFQRLHAYVAELLCACRPALTPTAGCTACLCPGCLAPRAHSRPRAPTAAPLMQRFPPGADRFEGVDYRLADCGSPVLNDSIAHMECKVRAAPGFTLLGGRLVYCVKVPDHELALVAPTPCPPSASRSSCVLKPNSKPQGWSETGGFPTAR